MEPLYSIAGDVKEAPGTREQTLETFKRELPQDPELPLPICKQGYRDIYTPVFIQKGAQQPQGRSGPRAYE